MNKKGLAVRLIKCFFRIAIVIAFIFLYWWAEGANKAYKTCSGDLAELRASWNTRLDPNSLEVCGPNLLANSDFEKGHTGDWSLPYKHKEDAISLGNGRDGSQGIRIALSEQVGMGLLS